jgi:hypothetical protein
MFLTNSLQGGGYIFSNYVGGNDFEDAASTALLASTVYRAAKILGQTEHLDKAEKSRLMLSTPEHFSSSGVLSTVVNPYQVNIPFGPGRVSPEAQAFVIQMHQAWKDWK